MGKLTSPAVGWLPVVLAVSALGLGLLGCAEEVSDPADPAGSPVPTATPSGAGPGGSVAASVVSVEVGGSRASGFVVTDAGHVLTFAGGPAEEAGGTSEDHTVTLHNGDSHPATLVGTDPVTSLAVVKLADPAPELAPARFGDSDALAVGDELRLLAGPLTLADPDRSGTVREPSLVLGTVSAVGIEATVAAGSAGGPVLDSTGAVVGVVAGIGGTAEGDEFTYALPANLATRVAGQLAEQGRASHPYLGVVLGEAAGGVVVQDVASGSPAAQAGLQVGDVLTEVGGRTVDEPAAVVAGVQSRQPGNDLELTYTRDGAENETVVTLAEAPSPG